MAGLFNLSVSITAAGAAFSGPETAWVTASAGYDDEFEINNGTGQGTLEITYDIHDGAYIYINQGGVMGDLCPESMGSCTVTSTFTYGVPFEVAASVGPITVSTFSGDNGESIDTGLLVDSMFVVKGNDPSPADLVPVQNVPEPPAFSLMLVGLLLLKRLPQLS